MHRVLMFRRHLALTKKNNSLMLIIMITRTMRDWNEPVRTCRIIGYQLVVNSTFTKMSYLGGDANKGKGGKGQTEKENDQCNNNVGFLRN